MRIYQRCVTQSVNMRLLLVLLFSIFSVWLQWSGPALAAPGDLDTTFDGDGRRVVNFTGPDIATDVAIQTDGKIVVVGYTDTLGSTDYQIVRLNGNGSLDTSFDGDGRRILDFSGSDIPVAVAIQADGKIVVAGYTDTLGSTDYQIVRLNGNGSLDTSFDGDGRRILNFSGADIATDVATQTDGKIVVVGYTNVFGSNDYQVVRLNSNGSLDTTFDGDGFRILNFTGNDIATDVAVQTDGKIVVVGYTNVFGSNDYQVVRLNSNGSLDTTFDGDGFRILNFTGNDVATDVAIQTDGKIVVVGYTNVFGSNDYQVVRLNSNGSLDTTFDGDGRRILNFSGADIATDVAVQTDGKIVVVGYTNVFGSNDYQIVRLNSTGSLDTTFDGDGFRILNFTGADIANAVALQSDGKFVVAGYTNTLGSNDYQIVRLLGP